MASVIERSYVWDVPTRLFHWLLVGLTGFSWWSAETRHMDWHVWSGIAVVGLLVFRILWGLFGSSSARFTRFVKGPRAVWRYLRAGEGGAAPGHNPLGSWSVVALLLLLAVQTLSGLFAVDVDGIDSGPFSYLVDFEQGRQASAIHSASFNLLLALVGLHLLAILFYLVVRRRNLIGAMVTGFSRHASQGIARAGWWRLGIAVAASLAVMGWIARHSPY